MPGAPYFDWGIPLFGHLRQLIFLEKIPSLTAVTFVAQKNLLSSNQADAPHCVIK